MRELGDTGTRGCKADAGSGDAGTPVEAQAGTEATGKIQTTASGPLSLACPHDAPFIRRVREGAGQPQRRSAGRAGERGWLPGVGFCAFRAVWLVHGVRGALWVQNSWLLLSRP